MHHYDAVHGGHIPRKRFGQHFLHDQGILRRIVELISPRPEQHLVEIGPGEGALTLPLLRAVIDQESGFHPCAVSPKGAQGLMQLMPGTADLLQVADPFDPKENIEAGAKYLKQLLDKNGGDISKALGAYNAGPNADDPSGKIPETKAYVDAILTKMGIKRTDPPSIPTPKPIGN